MSVTIQTLYLNSMWFPPNLSPLAFLHQFVFIILSTMTLLNFSLAAVLGPGYLPIGWKPKNKKHENYLQKCAVCPETYKAPRAHHCRKCNRCVTKMVKPCCFWWLQNNQKINILTSCILGSPLCVLEQLRWPCKSHAFHLVPVVRSVRMFSCHDNPHKFIVRGPLSRLLCLLSAVSASNSKTHNMELDFHSIQHWTCHWSDNCSGNATIFPTKINSKESNRNWRLDLREGSVPTTGTRKKDERGRKWRISGRRVRISIWPG